MAKLVFIAISLLVGTTALADGCASFSWAADFAQEEAFNREYKTAIDRHFADYLKKRSFTADAAKRFCPSANSTRPEPGQPNYRSECMKLEGLAGLETLPCFKYRVTPAAKKAKGTVIRLQGGPASILGPWNSRPLEDYDVLEFNDIGVGDNAFPIDKDFQWRSFGYDRQAKIVEQILAREKLKNYALDGGSYGTVSATVIGHHLSKTSNPPKGVLLVGVVPGATEEKLDKKATVYLPRTGADVSFAGNPPCALKQGEGCADDVFLKDFRDEERSKYRARLEELMKSPEDAPMRSLLRDALHWEYAQGPQAAAAFVKDVLLNGEPRLRLKCWYDREFIEIPWLNRFKAASQKAFFNSMHCQNRKTKTGTPKGCECLKDLVSYTVSDFQIQRPTRLFYVNGDSDSQTSLAGALTHFKEQTQTDKSFLKICGGGHMPMRWDNDEKERTVSQEEVYRAMFSSDPKALEKLPSFCSQAKPTSSAPQ